MAIRARGLSVLIATTAAVLAVAVPALATSAPSLQSHRTAHVCAAAARDFATCLAIKRLDVVEPSALSNAAVTPFATPSGYGPSDLRSAYALSASGSSTETVAIVDAYNDPNAESDLAAYRAQFGLPACTTANGCFRKVNQNGATSPLPSANQGWAGEISLDVDMVSAICPNCSILLVEASSASFANLGAAVNRAVTMGAKFVSNSYGGSESSSVTTYDAAYYNHPGVVVTASSGDSDYDGGSYPATGKYVTAVGGTSLVRDGSARGWGETVWNTTSYSEGAGSGCSSYIAKPTFQNGVNTGCTRRAEADVSAVADPNTGVAVYQTYGGGGWTVYGGTSVASPIVASVYALAGTPASSDYPNAYPYSHPANLNDVTSGSNGTCGAPICTAGAGWDGPTGLGTPSGTAAFTSGGGGTPPVSVTNPGNKTGTAGTAIAPFTLTASGGTGTYTWSATGLPPGVTIGPSTGTVSGTPSTPGTYTVTATATSGSASGSTIFTFTVGSSGGGGCASGQKLANPGFESGSASWSATSGVIGQNARYGEPPHTGNWNAYLDGYGTAHTDTLSQSVTIPSGCTGSTFSFWLHVDTAETTTTVAYDKLTVKIGSTTLATYSNLDSASGYTQRSFNAGAFAGQTVTVSFSGTEDSGLQTSFVVDDTALNAA